MIDEREPNVFREIEEEVMRLVKMAEDVDKKVSKTLSNNIKVKYCSILRDREEVVESIVKGELVLASLDGLEDGVLKKAIIDVKEEVEKNGGSLYLISKPVLLILPRNAVLVNDL
ncbi:MAG: cell division protein SepF [Aigarchaeota archaeon]|nr:cell division protein SepF [Aigarchaeota archaeon]MCX8192196.1 cell division protein SepF [Nitrososphaeria archaeon]MDW7986198.1 hypothetical protein [Nitrososphaerota archaeon]